MAILGACHNKIGIVMQLRKNVKITSVPVLSSALIRSRSIA